MGSVFIIRGFHWGYNDEVYYPCGNYIKSTFENEADAIKEVLSLERSHWKDIDLGETDQFFDTDQNLIDKVNEFVNEKCGKPLFTDDDRRDTFIPNNLNNEDFSEFLKISGLNAFKLTKFDTGQKFYAIWFPDDEDYLKKHDEYSEALVYSESIDLLKEESDPELEYHWDGAIRLKGELSELSDSPAILKTLIDNNSSFKYEEDKKCLVIKSYDVNDLFSVNELLKTPLFEIKELTVDEIKELESEMGDEEEYY